ncbi:Sterol 3-beta-glucosyltransferase UGT80B1 [Cytospora mali]|uniref:Sterol 3-beta-glucosyltransferase UGT80B1 n=1 Tax=Cytospora mali TaxID=578113 RepID=A0A194UZL0_CYTMA|nr:Sterol 3-beta-glucosyltransferase UGT80B1 [Valsa mali var. pyri (nom. inval.)]
MVEKTNTGSFSNQPPPRQGRVADAFSFGGDGANSPLDLGASEDAPPAYGELYDQLNLSQAGFNAGAVVTDDGRVNIKINQTNRRLADLLAPTLRSQLLPSEKPSSQPLPPAYIPPSLGGQPGQTPPPKLNVVIQIVGSRGDVQPFVALGKVLKDTYGHRVRVATHGTFQKFVEENGLEFFCIGGDPAELMAFMVKNPGLMPGIDALKNGEITRRRQGIEQIVLGCWRSCMEAGDGRGPPPATNQSSESIGNDFSLPGDPEKKPFVADAIIANPPSFAHIHIAEKMGIPLHMMFTMPWSPTRSFPHPLANIESTNTDVVMTNYISYALVEMMTWQGLGDVINRFRTKVLDLEPLSLIWAPGILSRLHIPTTYCWSPALIPKPNDWGREIAIPGFYFLDLATAYTPEPDLAAFLEAGPPPVYIGFGSIVVDDPNKLTRMIFDAISISGVRALVSKGWGGLGADSVGIPEGVFMLGNCPHDWLFKKVSCVVHHGGAGTTAAGIKTGTPTVIVPFFGDQPFWGSMIAKAGAGPPPISYKDMTAQKLADAITTALQPQTQARAKELGEKIRQEKGTDLGAKSFHDFLDYDKLRCSIAPSRTAVWRVRRTRVKLSALAAAVLVQERLIEYTDLKLYRAQEYDTEEQPWDPITAVTSALVGDVGSIAMALGDIPRDWYKAVKKTKSGTDTPSGDNITATTSTEAASIATHEAASSSRLTLQSDTASTTSAQPSTQTGLHEKKSDAASSSDQDLSTQGQGTPQAPLVASPESSKPSGSKKDPTQINVEAALGLGLETTKGISRIVETGFKSPMNFTMGLAKGFRNAPKLYNDDTVRKQEKVTGFGSGFMVAWKELGLGVYDGVSGLATQPIRGAQKEGGVGFIKGFGKGIGGLILKPAAGVWSVPAYMMKGLHAEVRAKFHHSVENYIIVSRILQGQDDLRSATVEEQNDIVLRFHSKRDELKGFYMLKYKEKNPSTGAVQGEATRARGSQEDLEPIPDSPPRTGFWNTGSMSSDERKKLSALKDAWKNKNVTGAAAALLKDPEMERAIRESVAQTSHGDENEDVMIEAQIRASSMEDGTRPGLHKDITDEEFEELVAEAVRQSMIAQTQVGLEGVGGEDEYLAIALEESKRSAEGAGEGGAGVDDDEELRKVLEESQRAHQEDVARRTTEKSEEEIILEYRALEESLRVSGKEGGPSSSA